MDDDVVLTVLRENLFPKFDSAFKTLNRELRRFGKHRYGKCQNYKDNYSGNV